MNKSTTNRLYIFIFCSCLVLPGLFSLGTLNNGVSENEKRRLNAAPTFPTNSEELHNWPKLFDNYFKDNFGFRSSFLTFYHDLKYWLKDSTGTDVIYGSKPGWLFYNNKNDDPIGDFRNINQFTKESLEQFITNLKAKQQWLAEQGIEYLFVITPSKHYIYPEYLPNHIKRIKQNSAKDQLATELKKHPEIHYLDLTEPILQHKSQQLLYFKADTHWNYFAANLAQRFIIQKANTILGLTSPIRQWQNDEFKFQFNHQGDLAYLIKAGEHFAEPLLKPEFDACTHISLNQLLLKNSQNATHCDSNKLNVLIYHDSFFNLLQPFISTHFSDVRYRKQRFKFKSAEIEISNGIPNIVIEQHIDRLLPDVNHP